jgi:hypothetical protein
MSKLLAALAPYHKAIFGGLAAGVVAVLSALDGGVTAKEWGGIALAVLGGAGVVYVAPKNVPAPVAGERGDMDAGLMLMVLTFVGVVLLLFGVTFR